MQRGGGIWPISSVTGIHPARQLSGDKLPAALVLRRPAIGPDSMR